MTAPRRIGGAVGGGLVAGLGITALMMAMERKQRKPSELIALQRATQRRLGSDARPDTSLPTVSEQAVAQGGHLLLSAVAGAAYAMAFDEDARVVPSGALFGLVMYVALHGIAGPALRVTAPEWKSDPKTIAMHAGNHILFGLLTAWGARLARRR